MKSFACILLISVVAAEPGQFRQNPRFQRQEVDTTNTREAPYAPAGFRPATEFKLPARQESAPPPTSYGVPDDSYGAPLKTYVSPQQEYGLPEKTPDTEYGVPRDESRDEDDEDLAVEGVKGKLLEQPKNDAEVVSAQGSYYVLLPDSQLQRVQFQTENDARNMAYTARLQYRNEDRAPVYVYTAVPQYQPSAAYVHVH